MMPVPVPLCQVCKAEVWKVQGKWHHLDAVGMYHDAKPMTDEERRAYNHRMADLLRDVIQPRPK